MKTQTAIHQTTIRISEKLFQDSKKEADLIGSSHNSYIALMIKLGMKVYNSDTVIRQDIV